MASGQTKTNEESVVEAKGEEDEEINGYKNVRGSYTNWCTLILWPLIFNAKNNMEA
jgi:hypothetical protein